MLKYLYYRLYKFFQTVESHLTPEEIRIPKYLAYFAMAILITLNLISIDIVVYSQFEVHIFLKSTNRAIITYLFVLLILYIFILRKKKFLLIIEKHVDETEIARKRSILLTLLYIVFTVILLVTVS